MQYAQYVQRIVKRYRVGLVGWTHRTFASPSCLSEGESEIQKLFDALLNGSCRFVKLLDDKELAAHIKDHESTIQSGAMVLVQKESRAKGKKKGEARQNQVVNSEEEDAMATA